MPAQELEHERVEFERPPYGGSFIFQMVLLAFATFGLQWGLIFLMPEGGPWSIGQSSLAMGRGALGIQPAMTVLPGSSVIWQGELWVSVVPGQMMSGPTKVRTPSSHLIAFDLQTGKSREPNIILSPAPVGLLVLDDQLWAVSETVVNCIQNNQSIPRHPRRALFQPTKPFVYGGRLAVIDKNRNDVYSLLTWNEVEWIEEGRVEAPSFTNNSPWFTPELRVITDGHSYYMFFSDGQTISYREGIVLASASDPVSALRPENSTNASTLAASMQYPGWQNSPFATNWTSSWEVAFVNNEILAFTLASPYSSSAIQQYKYQGGTWVNATPRYSVEAASFGVASGSPGYLVTDDLRLFEIRGSTLQRVTAGFQISERLRQVLFIGGLFARYLIAMGVLVLGTWWLMRIHRRQEYLYGKRTVIQASILRRGIARGIDSLISVFPVVFWFSVVLDGATEIQQQTTFTGIKNPVLMMLLSILGIWLGIVLIFSYMEGCWGITPGKWLCGIRTLRTTLRPCGILRALARELLVYADSVFLLTWLPGVLLIAFTPHWQRLGDLTADTVVVIDPKR